MAADGEAVEEAAMAEKEEAEAQVQNEVDTRVEDAEAGAADSLRRPLLLLHCRRRLFRPIDRGVHAVAGRRGREGEAADGASRHRLRPRADATLASRWPTRLT